MQRLVRSSLTGNWLESTETGIVRVPASRTDPKGYYRVLGVRPTATRQQVRAAARKKMLKEHPDTGGNRERFEMIHEAYEVLSDDRSRAAYDVSIGKEVMLNVDEIPEGETSPAWYKAPFDVLTTGEVAAIVEWQRMVYDAAVDIGLTMEVKVGICDMDCRYAMIDGIMAISRKTKPEKWAAYCLTLREKVKKCLT